MPSTIETLTLADAKAMIAAGEEKAEEIGIAYNIAAVDAGGNLVAFARMDGAWIGSIDIAIDKAFTARAFDMRTDTLSEMAQSGKSLFGIHTTNDDRVVVFGGGVPIQRGDAVIGAVGASGGTVDEDLKVARAACEALSKSRERADEPA